MVKKYLNLPCEENDCPPCLLTEGSNQPKTRLYRNNWEDDKDLLSPAASTLQKFARALIARGDAAKWFPKQESLHGDLLREAELVKRQLYLKNWSDDEAQHSGAAADIQKCVRSSLVRIENLMPEERIKWAKDMERRQQAARCNQMLEDVENSLHDLQSFSRVSSAPDGDTCHLLSAIEALKVRRKSDARCKSLILCMDKTNILDFGYPAITVMASLSSYSPPSPLPARQRARDHCIQRCRNKYHSHQYDTVVTITLIRYCGDYYFNTILWLPFPWSSWLLITSIATRI